MRVLSNPHLHGFGKGFVIGACVLLVASPIGMAVRRTVVTAILGPFLALPFSIMFWTLTIATLFAATLFAGRSIGVLVGAGSALGVYVLISYGADVYERVRREAETEAARAALSPRFLERSIRNPIGRVPTLLILEHLSCDFVICYPALAGDVVERVALVKDEEENGVSESNPLKMREVRVTRTFYKTQGEPCFSPKVYGGEYGLQELGIFGSCVVLDDTEAPVENAVLLLDGHSGYQARPNGLQGWDVSAAYKVENGRVTDELARWEWGRLGWYGPIMGSEFESIDFLRALNGAKTDAVRIAATLSMPERIDAAFASIGSAPIDIAGALKYFSGAYVPGETIHADGRREGTEKITLDQEHIQRLLRVVSEACKLTVTAKKPYEMDNERSCKADFDRFVSYYLDKDTAAAIGVAKPW